MGSETSILRSKWSQNGSHKSPQGHLGHPLGALGTMLGASGAAGALCGALGGLFGSSGEVFGSSSGRFWEHFGSIFDGFWSVFWISSETNYEALFSWVAVNFFLFFLKTLPKLRRSLPLEKQHEFANVSCHARGLCFSVIVSLFLRFSLSC